MRKSITILLLFFLTIIQAQTKMITPPYLKKGDTIAIVATARKNIDDNLKFATDLLNSWGLNVKIGSTIGLDLDQLAGTDAQRAKDFQDQMDNSNIKAIWCVRGGYGTVRMIDLLDFTKFKLSPKWIIGFSDVTVLHNHLNTMGFKSIHGIMPVSSKATEEAKETLRISLFGEKLKYEIDTHPMNKMGRASGELPSDNKNNMPIYNKDLQTYRFLLLKKTTLRTKVVHFCISYCCKIHQLFEVCKLCRYFFEFY